MIEGWIYHVQMLRIGRVSHLYLNFTSWNHIQTKNIKMKLSLDFDFIIHREKLSRSNGSAL